MHVVELNLPAPPESIVSKIRNFAYNLPKNDQSRNWLNQFHSNKINAVDQSFQLFNDIDDEINELYQGYFECKISPLLGIMKNVTEGTACLPPHCDRGRNTAINFYIDLGGSNVITNFYNYHRVDETLPEAKNISYENLVVENSYCFKEHTWYAYGVQQCHSVENVKTTRIALMLGLKTNIKFDNFKLQYNHLFCN